MVERPCFFKASICGYYLKDDRTIIINSSVNTSPELPKNKTTCELLMIVNFGRDALMVERACFLKASICSYYLENGVSIILSSL